MKKQITAVLAAGMLTAVWMTGCGEAYGGESAYGRDEVYEIEVAYSGDEALEKKEAYNGAERQEAQGKGNGAEETSAVRVKTQDESGQEMSRRLKRIREPKAAEEPETVSRSESVGESEISPGQEEVTPHVCTMDSGSTVTVLAFGQQEPDCFYGAEYNVKCSYCGKILDVIYQGPLGHTGKEGVVTCQPDCTGEGSIKYTCIRCGAEWSEAYGRVQPHTWTEGIRKETDWENGGTKEVRYLYCSVCGKREESE
ncbi:MAG: hypothetical protein NC517_03145 [Firmicutes bacterium]|nr:hypothetical protein [Bacillota bacterium]